MTPEHAAAQDRAHLIVTHLVERDRQAAAEEWDAIVQDDPELVRVGLLLADLAAFLVYKWAEDVGEYPDAIWQRVTLEVAAWRMTL